MWVGPNGSSNHERLFQWIILESVANTTPYSI